MSSTTPLKKGYKFPIYPTAEQKELLSKTFGCCRYVYNRALANTKANYETWAAMQVDSPGIRLSKPAVSGFAFSALLPIYKADPNSLWLSEVSYIALQQTMLHLGKAFQRFFNVGRGYPCFKSKYGKQSFSLMRNAFTLSDGVFKIAKCDTPIKVGFSRKFPSEPSSCTISRTPTGQYFVSFVCKYLPPKTNGTGRIGIDLGIKDFAVLSTGEHIANPRYYAQAQRCLKRLQQTLSRRAKGSANRNKARQAVAKAHARIANLRSNFQHQLSRRLVNENQVIGLETLMVANMVKNGRLSKAIADVAWSSFVQKLSYKVAESQHCTLVRVETFFPSSHLCHVTGLRLDRKLKLSERSWDCPHCGQTHDRDVNAALNLLIRANQLHQKYGAEQSAGLTILANPR